MIINSYKTVIFDCDGVILDSNKIKTVSFYKAAMLYGEKKAQSLVNYHVDNGGVSRYKKFQWFLDNLLTNSDFNSFDFLVKTYADEVVSGLLTCETDSALATLFDSFTNSNWLVISGGDQEELRKVFNQRDISKFFKAGIFGSPLDKYSIVEEQIKKGNIFGKTVFIGDSKYDYEVSQRFGFDFIFISHWSEFSDYKSFFSNKEVLVVNDLSELLR